MKFLLITIFFITCVQADEINRIESIVQDITELRSDYEVCQNKLKALIDEDRTTANVTLSNTTEESTCKKEKVSAEYYKALWMKEKNRILLSTQNKSIKSEKKIDKIIKTKDNEILALKKEYLKKIKSKDEKIKSLESALKSLKKKSTLSSTTCENENSFPKLVMKEKYEKIEIQNSIGTYRLKVDSDIYNRIDGKVVDSWERGVSFTSSKSSKNWLKITGYFVNKKWTPAIKNMWIKKVHVIKR